MSREEKKRSKQARVDAGYVRHPGKHPRVAEQPATGKQPRSLGIDDEDSFQRRPVWRFADIDMGAPASTGSLTVTDFTEMHAKLGEYEKQKCSEIWSQQDNGCKRYAVEDAHENITSRLVDLERDDETAVHTLRVNGKFRIYGVLRHHVFYILWIDREHEMFPSKLKNT